MRLHSVVAFAAMLSASLVVHASTLTTITFGQLPGPDNGVFNSYTESGFTISTVNGVFNKATNNVFNFGNPEPDIYTIGTGAIQVREAGSLFSFDSLDLGFFNAGTIGFTLTGLLNGNTLFTQTGSLNDKVGNSFLTLAGANKAAQITNLRVAITSNDTGGANIDNIRLTSNTVTPEPSSLMLLGTGALGLVGAMKRRFA